jgi:hypothetical protein
MGGSFVPWLLHHQRKSPWYALYGKMDGFQSWCECGRKEKILALDRN